MEELVNMERISAQLEAENWKDAIRRAGELLVESGDIETQYIDNMIASVEELGPYVVLTKGFALAHSAPCAAVKHSSISLINLKDPVEFGSRNDPVRVVMCLACVDKEAHIELLQKIAVKLMTPGMIDKLAECKTDNELYLAINN